MSEVYIMRNVSVRRIEQDELESTNFTFHYTSNSYYDIEIEGSSFNLILKQFENELSKQYEDTIFGEWLESPDVLGIFVNDEWAGFIEGSIEMWNNRYRISNLLIFDKYRNNGLASKLINEMILLAKSKDARMIVLEVLSNNTNAIHLYQKHGFKIIGFDLFAYSNLDINNKSFRIDMGLKL